MFYTMDEVMVGIYVHKGFATDMLGQLNYIDYFQTLISFQED